MESQSQYRNLHHISFWEIAVARLALWDVNGSSEFWRGLVKEATVRIIPVLFIRILISSSLVVEVHLLIRSCCMPARNW